MALDLSTLTPQEQVASLFVGYFDRAPAPSGLNYWVGELTSGNMTITEIAASFGNQPEATGLYPLLGAPNLATDQGYLDLVTDIFDNLLGRAPANGLDNYYVQQLIGGADIGQVIVDIISGAQGADKALLENKIEVGLDWAASALANDIATSNNPLSEVINGQLIILDQAAYDSARSVLDGVTDDPATVVAAQAEITAFLDSIASEGQTFTLTKGIDAGADFVGTGENDTFLGTLDGTNDTFTLGDDLDGASGTDTFRLLSTEAGADLSIASLSSVENFELRSSNDIATVDLADNAFDTVVIDGRGKEQTQKAEIGEIANGSELTITGADFDSNNLDILVSEETGSVAVTVNLVDIDDANVAMQLDAAADGSSAADTVNLVLDGVKNTDGGMQFYTTDAETFNVTVVSDSELENIGSYYNNDSSDFGPAVVNLVLDADLTISSFWDLSDTADVETTFNISGAGDLSIADFDDGSSDVTVDGSAATGDLELLAVDSVFVSVTTGSGDDTVEITDAETAVATGEGNDTVIVGSNLNATDSDVDGGAGDADVLSVSASIADNTTDYSDNMAGFETLAITGGLNGTVDVDNFDGIQSVDVQAALAGASTITGLATGATVAYSADANMGSVLSIDMTDATDPNTPNDTLNVVFNADLNGGDNNSANLSVDGINVLNVSATDSDNKDEATDQADGYTLNLSNEENVDAINISGDRAVSYTASAEATELNSVDGSAAEGDLNIDLARFSGTEGIELTAGAGDDDLIGTGLSDIVVGGDGDDNITGDAPTTIVSAGVPQVSTFTIANAEAGDVFSIGSTDVEWTGVEATDNDAVTLALANEITGEQSISVDANAVATGGTWTVTGAVDGSAFANPDLDTTNLPAAGDALTIELTGATFGTGELINYTVNGGSIVSVNVSGLSLAAATTAVVSSLNNQLGLTATSTTAGSISVVGPAGAGNNVTIDMMVADDATDNPAGGAGDQEVTPETAAVPEVWTITPTDLEATETLSVTIGATSYSVVFDTDLATTLGNFVSTHETAINAQTGGTLAATANTLTITDATGGDLTGGAITGTIIGGDGGTATVTETDGTPEVPGIDNTAEVTSDPVDESANAGTDNQTLTVSTAAGTLEVTAGGQTSDELTGGAGSDIFNFASGDSTATAMDVITDFETGDATIDFDTLNLGSTDVLADVLLANQIDVSQNSEDATPATDIGAIVQDGIIAVVGADAAEIDTLDEWGDVVLQVLTAQGGNQVAAFEFEGSTYVVEENANVIELADTVGIVGISTTEDTDVIHIM
ncbi:MULTISPECIES: DUF4214 domain-containing protein [Marivita]|uniref:DUF4214 domain-containing protein n=1 Tax=Marivita cryptomonadis TaxID=505252 RepID=A0A9Q2P4C9_9RHOB|nr:MULTISPECIES: DUF4214 domain-containing protein [Marivita]MBM2324296.1 DUF4214 domain-containing protein [Marivita cryptomonadis]MBM2333879.1 DUF4214 domain-containing protein [Marivita cryptomonadis]MBM2343453.1 DUF4214 domain-containing protein [Marivita cryptomonadis]MBM2348136.1 DUF4214 domain-containing protein [Marivita cryptomonadis]MBM2352815.1 DUF4214 domain-containing protein [Marivita cryptomonadis]